MPFEKKNPDPKGGINSIKYHKTLMNRIVNDETLPANRRFLAEMILLWMSSYGHEKEVIESLLLGANWSRFVDSRGVSLNDVKDGPGSSANAEQQGLTNNVADAIRFISGDGE